MMNKAEFGRAIGASPPALSNFLSKKGTMGGSGSSVYRNAFAWFEQREAKGLKMPDVKKRQRQELQRKEANVSSASGSSKADNAPQSKNAKTTAAVPDVSEIQLDHEETDEVPVYDTCDEIRKKINAHLKTPGLTQAQFCRDLYAQLKVPNCKQIQSKQLTDSRAQSGPRTGVKGTVFYAAYVYFEKPRIVQGKPKSKHRREMEMIHPVGFDRNIDNRTR